ncbi:Gldg family protein [Sphingobacterium faecale]|uniref:Gldg family protein n=1 Tax=Sphingobacterium faecale TaxID=2803775 RepID=A0ABS1R4L7_9SPHI|nr:Gldg family protein [Sphingobacterium faecale]MBL1409179.1 Gldg family protein [Sphingobacterium faecale]
MKTTLKIAKAELQVLFYSPVAWLILVIFALQTAIVYTGFFDLFARRQILGQDLNNVTYAVFNSSPRGFLISIQTYLYLYIPLLTMGVVSREYNSGSIKLLYSSPINSYQIVFGKYLALIVFALTLIGILGIFCLHGAISIENFDYATVLTGLLGLFLLICAYAAIGLFMSSVTSYTVVAAIGTLGILALLNLMKGWWQEIPLLRDITYWIAIGGRSNTFISGLITSEDVLYFLIVIALFLTFSIIKIQLERKKSPLVSTMLKYGATIVVVCILGYFSSMPKFKTYYDATYAKINTLREGSQKVVEKMTGPLTIHTYVNMLEKNYSYALPKFYKREVERFEKYLRFKPDIQVKHHYYYHRGDYPYLETRFPELNDDERLDSLRLLNNWDFPIKRYDEIADEVDLSGENFRFVHLLERENGERTFLRIFNDMQVHPSEAEITAAFKRLVMDLPKVGFVRGHGERESASNQDVGYNMIIEEKTFRHSLINQGFEFDSVSLAREVPNDIRILVVAEPRRPYSPTELQNLKRYIDRGGNMVIAGEPDVIQQMNAITEDIGVTFLPGTLAHADEEIQNDLILLKPTEEAAKFSYHLDEMKKSKYVLTMPSAAALQFDPSKGFEATTLFRTEPTGVWQEMNKFDNKDNLPTMDIEHGENEDEYSTVMALTRTINDKQQKILVTGDADWLSNGELGIRRPKVRAANYFLIVSAFQWLSDGEVPIDMRIAPAIDVKIKHSNTWGVLKNTLKIGFPLLLALVGVMIWIRRKGR